MLSYRHLDGLEIPGEVAESLVLEELTRWFRFETSCCVSEPKFHIITDCLFITLLAWFFLAHNFYCRSGRNDNYFNDHDSARRNDTGKKVSCIAMLLRRKANSPEM